jgi:hypothetical protein
MMYAIEEDAIAVADFASLTLQYTKPVGKIRGGYFILPGNEAEGVGCKISGN